MPFLPLIEKITNLCREKAILLLPGHLGVSTLGILISKQSKSYLFSLNTLCHEESGKFRGYNRPLL